MKNINYNTLKKLNKSKKLKRRIKNAKTSRII